MSFREPLQVPPEAGAWVEILPVWLLDTQVLIGLGVASVAVFVVSLLGLPWFISKIPADYFVGRPRRAEARVSLLGAVRYSVVLALRNALGLFLLLLGAIMLVTPGQGLATLFVGLCLLDFPKKWALLYFLLTRRPVAAVISRIRTRAGKPPLILPDRR